MKQKVYVGHTVSREDVTIELGFVRRFIDALQIYDPLSTSKETAQSAQLNHVLVPSVSLGSLGDYTAVSDLLELKPKQVLHSKEVVRVFKPVVVGDKLTVTTTISNIDEKLPNGNPVGFVTIDVVGAFTDANQQADVAFEVQRVWAIRGGFPRR